MKENRYVINPITKEQLSMFLDDKSKDIIKYFIIKSLFAQPEAKVGQRLLPIQIPKEHIEQWFTQSMNVKSVGAGSYPIDIYNEDEGWGADIKMLNIKIDKFGTVLNSDSGEASLGQKFEGPGIHLDTLFEDREFEQIKDKWVDLYRNKYESLKVKYPISKIYYLFILRPSTQINGADFYFTGAILDLNNLVNIKVDETRTTGRSVFLNNFIDRDYGHTKIYKAKKRLELRLRPEKWISNGMSIKIMTTFMSSNINLRELDINSDYLIKEMNKLKNVVVKFIK